MNTALSLSKEFGIFGIGEVLTFPFPVSKKAATRLSTSAVNLMQNISSILEEMVAIASDQRTVETFKNKREEVFPKFLQAVLAYSKLAALVVPQAAIERLASESFSEMEADVREHGLAAFGGEVSDQATFTIWTLRKISDICREISASSLTDDLKANDTEFLSRFVTSVTWSKFHLDCLLMSMRQHRPFHPEVREVIIDGLRAAVDAYAWARRGLNLRTPSLELKDEQLEWDAEDQALLEQSKLDPVACDLY